MAYFWKVLDTGGDVCDEGKARSLLQAKIAAMASISEMAFIDDSFDVEVSGGAAPQTVKDVSRDRADRYLHELEKQHTDNRRAARARHSKRDAFADIFPAQPSKRT